MKTKIKKNMFTKKLYKLSEDTDMLRFFDAIKDVFDEWIDKYLEGIDYELELKQSFSRKDASWVSITLGLNRTNDVFEKNKKLNNIDEWKKFTDKFESNFHLNNKKKLRLDIEGDINIFNY